MGYHSERASIETHLTANWPHTPIGYSSVTFEPIHDSIRLSIINGDSEQASFGSAGSNIERHIGIVAIQIFVNGGIGEDLVRQRADQISNIFRNRHIDNLTFNNPSVKKGTEVDAPFLVWVVMIPFRRDEYNA